MSAKPFNSEDHAAAHIHANIERWAGCDSATICGMIATDVRFAVLGFCQRVEDRAEAGRATGEAFEARFIKAFAEEAAAVRGRTTNEGGE